MNLHRHRHLPLQLGLVLDFHLPVEANERAGDDVGQPLENVLVEPREDGPANRVERLQHAETVVLVH